MAAAKSRTPFSSDCYDEAGKNAAPGASGSRYWRTDYPAGMKRSREQAGKNWTNDPQRPGMQGNGGKG